MAGPSTTMPQLPSLSSEQQSLLLAALESNKRNRDAQAASGKPKAVKKTTTSPRGTLKQQVSQTSQNESPSYETPDSSRSGSHTFGDGLLGDFFDTSPTFDADFPATNDDYFDDYTSFAQDDNGGVTEGIDAGEKRKSPDDDDSSDEAESGKRQEGDDKIAKKPGRKLITTEPTTVSYKVLGIISKR